WLPGEGGVDGAIHEAAGPELLQACKQIPEVRPGVRCPTGEVRITPGFALPARFVIHAVGPVWRGGKAGEPELLTSCYRNIFTACTEHRIRSVAIPAISCGAFGFPVGQASLIATRESRAALVSANPIGTIILVAIEPDVHKA